MKATPAVAVLVVAKAPVPGAVKTRLAASVGHRLTAELAAAALLDTVAVCGATFDTCVLALHGDLADGVQAVGLTAALAGWTVLPQRGRHFAARLAHAHAEAWRRWGGPVLQVGMDTPQMTSRQLAGMAARLRRGHVAGRQAGSTYDAVLGPAHDGGWWALGVTHPRMTTGLRSVPMSTPTTCAHTLRMLHGRGASVGMGEWLRDIDEAADAHAVSLEFPDLRFSARWSQRCSLPGRGLRTAEVIG